MTYFVVVGSLALSVLFTLGWALSRLIRWVVAGFPLEGESKSKRVGRKPAKRSGATRNKKSAAKARPKSQVKPAAKSPSPPWRITQRLAQWQSSTAFAIVVTFLYLAARLAEHGMGYRPPHALPSGFPSLINGLGWLAASLIFLALARYLALWRCR